MSKIKICGLVREEDVVYVNQAKADYAGFIINYPQSHRNVSPERANALKSGLAHGITSVGVFVNQPIQELAAIANRDIVDMIQLHGEEDEAYIAQLKQLIDKPIIKAFQIKTAADIARAERSHAEYILLDGGKGEGQSFDWHLLLEMRREYFLAGGFTLLNIEEAIKKYHPFAIDISSGVETEKKKDERKIMDAVNLAHKEVR